VNVVNTHAGAIAKALRCLRAAVVFVCCARPDCVIVVASGESGLMVEAIPLFATRVRCIPSSLTHHSAHYIREESRFLQVALAAGGPRLRHVVLDEAMGAELAARYRVEMSRVVVVDNAGLMPMPPTPDPVALRSGVVHLSNLSPAKGLVAVLEVAVRTNISVRLIGSITPGASSILEDARRRGVQFEALGPRYGDAKQRALLDARCFLFLSSYHHEAQPLVLYEAVSAGCVPIVWRAGWVGEQMERLGLGEYVLPVGDIEGAAQLVTNIVAMDDASFSLLSTRVRSAFESHHRSTVHQFGSAVE
jgi:glycosyltransferase involved in cell wall biosynthesis